MSVNFFPNRGSVLKTNEWNNENLHCGFSRDAMSLKIDQKIILPRIISF